MVDVRVLSEGGAYFPIHFIGKNIRSQPHLKLCIVSIEGPAY